MTSRSSTAFLVARSQKGDLRAFDELVVQHQGWVRGLLRSRLSDWSAADDLAQEAFVIAYGKIRTFRAESNFETWLRGIAINLLRNHLRKRKELYVGSSEDLQQLAIAFQGDNRSGEQEKRLLETLKTCLKNVSEKNRALLKLRYDEALSVREIAASTGRGHSAITMQLHRIRAVLAVCIQNTLREEPT